MGGVSIWHWLVVGVIVLLLFGRGKISDMMGDVAKGIKAFKKGMSEEEAAAAATPAATTPADPVRTIEHQSPAPAQPTTAAAPVGERKAG
ncbi:MAG: twin-arginine translocase TatA/TatE family subunit [Microvirga sp.]|jgi:sec-independent protein translocase protein TatA